MNFILLVRAVVNQNQVDLNQISFVNLDVYSNSLFIFIIFNSFNFVCINCLVAGGWKE